MPKRQIHYAKNKYFMLILFSILKNSNKKNQSFNIPVLCIKYIYRKTYISVTMSIHFSITLWTRVQSSQHFLILYTSTPFDICSCVISVNLKF